MPRRAVFLSLLLLPNIVAIFVAASIFVVIIASNDETRCIISKVKTLVAMVIMKTEDNNDGSNIKWSLEMVFEGACSLVFGCFFGLHWCGFVCFDKFKGHRVSCCISMVLLCWSFPDDTWLLRGSGIWEHFWMAISDLYLSLCFYYYLFLLNLCVHVLGCYSDHICTQL